MTRGFSPGMRQHRFGNLVTHAHHWIQRRHGLLKDHADTGAANVAHRWFRQRQQLFAAKLDAAANPRLRRKQSQQGQRADGFSRTRLAHQSQDFPCVNVEAHIADGSHSSLCRGKLNTEVADIEQRGHKAMLAGMSPAEAVSIFRRSTDRWGAIRCAWRSLPAYEVQFLRYRGKPKRSLGIWSPCGEV